MIGNILVSFLISVAKAFNISSLSTMLAERFFFFYVDIFIRFGMLTSMIHGPSYLLLWQMNVVESIPLLLPRVEQGAFLPLLDLELTKWMLGVGHVGCLDKWDVSECDIVGGLRCACAVSLHFCTSATTMRRAYLGSPSHRMWQEQTHPSQRMDP